MGGSYNVSLVVTSNALSLDELSARLERAPQSGSHDKGSPRLGGAAWDVAVWRENSRCPDAPLADQCLQLLAHLPPRCLQLRTSDPGDIKLTVDIAAFFDTACVSLTLPVAVLRALAEHGVALEVTAYPCTADAS